MKFVKITLAVAVAVTLSAPATAQVSYLRYLATYYSNVQMNVEVGHVWVTCEDQAGGDGYLTQYYEEQNWDC